MTTSPDGDSILVKTCCVFCLVFLSPCGVAGLRLPPQLSKSIWSNSFDTQNPAGCFPASLGKIEWETGQFPIEGLREILNKGNRLKDGLPHGCALQNNDNWCPQPRTDALLNPDDMLWYNKIQDYMKQALKNADTSLPTVASVWDRPIRVNAQSAQVENFICGFERLDMLNRTVIFATSEEVYDSLRKHFPHVTILFHRAMVLLKNRMSVRTNLDYSNRLWKLIAAQLLLDQNHDVLVSDTDIAWLQDSSNVLHKSDLEFAAMHDNCQHDLNSGFLYYRNTPKTRNLLHMTLSTWRANNICADNDQYLLNCGWMRAAVDGLKYGILPENGWTVKLLQKNACYEAPPSLQKTAPAWIGDGRPYAYHTYGMSTPYTGELDMLAAFGFYNVQSSTGKCKKGATNVDEVLQKVNLSCVAGQGGIQHALCSGSCQTQAKRTDDILADMNKRITA